MLFFIALSLAGCGQVETNVLYIYGDSLTMGSDGYTSDLVLENELFDATILMPDGFNGGSSAEALVNITQQAVTYTHILINSGLHDMLPYAGWTTPRTPPEQYRENLKALFSWFQERDIVVYWRLITPIIDEISVVTGWNQSNVDIYNGVAQEVAKRYENVYIMDVNRHLEHHPELYFGDGPEDGVHLSSEGSEVLAELLLSSFMMLKQCVCDCLSDNTVRWENIGGILRITAPKG